MNPDPRPPTQTGGLPLLICTWMLSWGSMKLSLPALPELRSVFDVPGEELRITITVFFVCFALGQLAWGMISDQIGRRTPLIAGLVIGAVGTIIVLFSEGILMFGIGRGLEGLGLSAVSPICRAIVFQTRGTDEGRHALARVASFTAMVPLLGQVIGGYIVACTSWRWIFGGFLAANLVMIASLWWRLAEPPAPGQVTDDTRLLTRLLTIARHPEFWSNTIIYMTCSGTLLGYYAAMPFWYTDHLDVPVQVYPWLAAFTVGIYMLGLLSSRWLAGHFNQRILMWTGLLIAILPGLLLLLTPWGSLSRNANIAVLVAASMVLASGASLVFPGANAGAVRCFPQWSGLVSAGVVTCVFMTAGITAYTLGSADPTNLPGVGLNLLIPPAIGLAAGVVLHRYALRAKPLEANPG